MAKKPAASPQICPEHCYVKELPGEQAPSFAAMKRLYALASDLFRLRPWEALDESQLIVVSDSKSGELCYCSVMGALGEVYSMHAYIGAEGFRVFRKMQAEEIADPGEFFASMRSVNVEFVSRAELERQDRELLAALGHPKGRGNVAPIFRATRPGFHAWFVTADEAQVLEECIRAVIVVCIAVATQKKMEFWREVDTYPMVMRLDGAESGYRIDIVKPSLPPEPPTPKVCVDKEMLRPLRARDFARRGVMELDYIFGGIPIGNSNERKAFASIALAVDADTGIVYAPEVISSNIPCGDALSRVFLKAIQSNHALPTEVRVRNQKAEDSLEPLMKCLGVKLCVARRFRAADQARAHLLEFLGKP